MCTGVIHHNHYGHYHNHYHHNHYGHSVNFRRRDHYDYVGVVIAVAAIEISKPFADIVHIPFINVVVHIAGWL